jgi:hypothetical protein
MSLFSTSGARPVALTPFPANAQAGKAMDTQVAPASGKLAARLPTVDPTSFLDDVVSLSSQALQARGGELATSTSDIAQNFMTTFAKRLFGDETGIAKVAYNMTSFKASSSYSASSTEASGPDGTVRSTTFDMSQSASFTGTGQITTDDGRIFDFELSVKYEARVEASSTEAVSKQPTIEAPDVLVLTGKPLPAIKFPGSLDDLFKLLSRELRTEVSDGADRSGDLTLRLMRLVDRAALLAPRVRADDPDATPTERAKAVADTYGNGASLGASSAA